VKELKDVVSYYPAGSPVEHNTASLLGEAASVVQQGEGGSLREGVDRAAQQSLQNSLHLEAKGYKLPEYDGPPRGENGTD
jgi:hypothetical protein